MSDDIELVRAALPTYEVDDEIGRGGYGVVLAATQRGLGRKVAVKQLPRTFASNPAVRDRFVNEARLLATLDHPHIVPVHDFIETDRVCLLIMELLEGGSLADRRLRGDLTVGDACAYTLAACAGLSAAHVRGVLHRDVKPQNLLFNQEGVMKIVDFGIAKILGGNQSVGTVAGDVVGSPAYMAPEQVTGEPPSPATDVYALATTLYELLSGHLPFPVEGERIRFLVVRATEDPRPIDQVADVPPALASVLMRGLARMPAERFQTAHEFGVALAMAATDSLGRGWLAATETWVYGSSRLMVALDAALDTSMPPSPKSEIRLPEQSRESLDLRPERLQSKDLEPENLVPVTKLVGSLAGKPVVVFDVEEPDRPPQQRRIEETTEVGRRCSGLNLVDPELSRRHFQVVVEADGVRLRDLGSTNGTFVNGVAISAPVTLAEGDTVLAGQTRLRVATVSGVGGRGDAGTPAVAGGIVAGQEPLVDVVGAAGPAVAAPPLYAEPAPAAAGPGRDEVVPGQEGPVPDEPVVEARAAGPVPLDAEGRVLSEGPAEPPDVVTALRRVAIFNTLPDTDLDEVRALLTEGYLAPGGLAQEGRWIGVIRQGEADLVRVGPDGTEEVLAVLVEGESFGVAAVLGWPLDAVLRARTEVYLHVLDEAAITALRARLPAVDQAFPKSPAGPPGPGIDPSGTAVLPAPEARPSIPDPPGFERF